MAPDTWAVVAGRGARTPGSPLNVPPVLASNFGLVGCENVEDLWADLDDALAAAVGGGKD